MNKRNLYIALFLIFAITLFITISVFSAKDVSAAVGGGSCTDTFDGGRDKYVLGETAYWGVNGYLFWIDTCFPDGSLEEHYCENNFPVHEEIWCSEGEYCSNGACQTYS